jgi:DNA-binding PadR family transcriptional regulator
MSTKHALLGLLLEGSSYPYQLADRLKDRLGPAWALNSGDIYKTIGKMTDEGLIEFVGSGPQGRDRRRRFFSITASGEQEFERWLEAISGTVRLRRRPQLLKVALAGPKRLNDALLQIDVYEQSCTKLLNEFQEAQDLIPRQQSSVRADHVLLRLNLSIDISLLEGELQRARETREMLLWLHAQPQTIWPSTTDRSDAQKTQARRGAREELFEGMAAKQHRRPKREKLGRQ